MLDQQIKLDNKINRSSPTPSVKFVGITGALERIDLRSFDGLHLSRKGYNVLAGEIFEHIRGDCVKAEFDIWKGLIGDIVPKGSFGNKGEKAILEAGFEVIDKVYAEDKKKDSDSKLRKRK